MWIMPEKRLCFLANPKTASTAVGNTLHSLGFQTIGDQHCVPSTSGWRHWPVIDESWTTFCVVRNHFDVMVSWYLHLSRKPNEAFFGWPFEAALFCHLDNPLWFKKGRMYWERNPLCNVVLRYETLQADFDKLLADHDLPATELQVHNVSKQRRGRDSMSFYSDKAADFLAHYFKAEMTELGYS